MTLLQTRVDGQWHTIQEFDFAAFAAITMELIAKCEPNGGVRTIEFDDRRDYA